VTQKFIAKLTTRKYFIIRTSEEWLYKRFVRSSFHKKRTFSLSNFHLSLAGGSFLYATPFPSDALLQT